MTMKQRFLKKVRKTEKCWWWIGCKSKPNPNCDIEYGYFKMDKLTSAHRASYELFKGEIPKDRPFVLHKCDNGLCVRPGHLYAGTHQDNMDDAVERGRMPTGDRHGSRLHPEKLARGDRHGSHTHPERRATGSRNGQYTHPEASARGERHGKAKLTEDIVHRIRARHAIVGNAAAISREFDLGYHVVSDLIRGRTWSHL